MFVRGFQSHHRHRKQKAVNKDHPGLNVRRHVQPTVSGPFNLYYQPHGDNLAFMAIIDRRVLETQ